jgi:hypothetical protein
MADCSFYSSGTTGGHLLRVSSEVVVKGEIRGRIDDGTEVAEDRDRPAPMALEEGGCWWAGTPAGPAHQGRGYCVASDPCVIVWFPPFSIANTSKP